jgi:hypothetical protein
MKASIHGHINVFFLSFSWQRAPPGLIGRKRTSLGNLRKSKSSSTADRQQHKTEQIATVDMTMKRRSTGCLRRASFYSTKSTKSADASQINKVKQLVYAQFDSFSLSVGERVVHPSFFCI